MSAEGGRPLAGEAISDTDRAWPAERKQHWGEEAWWRAQIDAALAGEDPVIGNLRITLVHQELSLALNQLTGTNTGANFHTWAVWGSKTAGRTIRREDLPTVARAGATLGPAVAASAVIPVIRHHRGRRAGLGIAGAGLVSGLVGFAVNRLVDRAAHQIFAGNATVLDDIGRQTARFLSALSRGSAQADRNPLEDFLAGLKPGPAVSGGQDLLGHAYRHYDEARRETDRDRQEELMLCANLLAILHEHERLDPYIDASVPPPLRRFVTKRMLSFSVGAEAMKVSADVPTRVGSAFPAALAAIDSPELKRLLSGPQGWDRTPDTAVGSSARDWSSLADRMNFIVDLFRTRQEDLNLFTPPYSPAQTELIRLGRIPEGPL